MIIGRSKTHHVSAGESDNRGSKTHHVSTGEGDNREQGRRKEFFKGGSF